MKSNKNKKRKTSSSVNATHKNTCWTENEINNHSFGEVYITKYKVSYSLQKDYQNKSISIAYQYAS